MRKKRRKTPEERALMQCLRTAGRLDNRKIRRAKAYNDRFKHCLTKYRERHNQEGA